MRDTHEGVTVAILGKDFMVACPENKRAALIEAAAYLDKKMREIHGSGKVIGTERTAIMAALNIAHELIELRGGGVPDEVGRKLRFLQNKIDAALNLAGARQ